MGVLDGIRVIEIASAASPAICGMMLADMGADVIVVEAPTAEASRPRPADICNRGKRSIILDLQERAGVETVLDLVDSADIFIEGAGPGVAEQSGFGPEVCLSRRPSLVYGRTSCWGHEGPLAHVPGGHGNSTAVSGTLWMATAPGQRPTTHAGLLGVVGGSALYLAIGVLAGALRAREDGRGQIVDAATVDGSAHLLNLLAVMVPDRGSFASLRPASEESFVMRSYRCADGEWINLSAIEPKFYSTLLRKLGLDGDEQFVAGLGDKKTWYSLAGRLETLFAGKPRSAWCELLEGTEACFAPVLAPQDAARHPHNLARGLYVAADGILQVVAAPRFGATPSARPAPVPMRGEHTEEVLMQIRTHGS